MSSCSLRIFPAFVAERGEVDLMISDCNFRFSIQFVKVMMENELSFEIYSIVLAVFGILEMFLFSFSSKIDHKLSLTSFSFFNLSTPFLFS